MNVNLHSERPYFCFSMLIPIPLIYFKSTETINQEHNIESEYGKYSICITVIVSTPLCEEIESKRIKCSNCCTWSILMGITDTSCPVFITSLRLFHLKSPNAKAQLIRP